MKRLLFSALVLWILQSPAQAGEIQNRDPDVDGEYNGGSHSVDWLSLIVVAGVIVWVWQGGWMKNKDEK
jgi:hypothetical protein